MNDYYAQFAASRLAALRARSLCRETPDIDHGADRQLLFQGRPLLNLASNNYLGLAGAPELTQASVAATREYGAGSGASRLVTGTCRVHDALDAALAVFKAAPAALALGSGFAANLAVFAAFADRHTVVFADKLSHASIIDGILLSGARLARFRHNDLCHLAELLDKHRDIERKIVVTESVFSMDGDAPDLREFARLAREHGALAILDEAHAVGVFGRGRGLAHEAGVSGDIGVQIGTFSKALGSCGGYLAASEDYIALVRNLGRAFIYSTAPPPGVAAANLAALELVAAANGLPLRPGQPGGAGGIKESAPGGGPGARLLALAATAREHLRSLGFDTGESVSQIVPVILCEEAAALAAKEFLIERGVYAAAIRPPTVPAGTARLRLSFRADLTGEDLELVDSAFTALARTGFARKGVK
jgi:8-amino-7-oxononanoate synthase